MPLFLKKKRYRTVRHHKHFPSLGQVDVAKGNGWRDCKGYGHSCWCLWKDHKVEKI